jgi:hypothetical protein
LLDAITGDYEGYQTVGYSIAVLGSALSVFGTFANNLLLDHVLAMQIWMFSNPILLAWAFGNRKGWWDGGLSIDALMVMYAVFTVTNFIGLFLE